jgi:hypothetical protein
MTSEVSTDTQLSKPRVFIPSLRNIFQKDVFRGPHYEDEDM